MTQSMFEDFKGTLECVEIKF